MKFVLFIVTGLMLFSCKTVGYRVYYSFDANRNKITRGGEMDGVLCVKDDSVMIRTYVHRGPSNVSFGKIMDGKQNSKIVKPIVFFESESLFNIDTFWFDNKTSKTYLFFDDIKLKYEDIWFVVNRVDTVYSKDFISDSTIGAYLYKYDSDINYLEFYFTNDSILPAFVNQSMDLSKFSGGSDVRIRANSYWWYCRIDFSVEYLIENISRSKDLKITNLKTGKVYIFHYNGKLTTLPRNSDIRWDLFPDGVVKPD